ncbi:MAG: lipoyl(octanoyl) transferase LipB [Thermodesulfobacteriota bacterium]
MPSRLLVAETGIVPVCETERLMEAAKTQREAGDIDDMLLILAHPKTVAAGLKDRNALHPKDLLVPLERLEAEGIDFVRSVRGGGITYHWPGQVVCYPVMALDGRDRNIPEFMHKLEQTAIDVLAEFGISAARRRDTPSHIGLWHQDRKIVSMGIRISKWITSFGFAVNHSGDYSPSKYVRPCGIEGLRLITMEDVLGEAPPRAQVADAVKTHFARVFGRVYRAMPSEDLTRLLIPSRFPKDNTKSLSEK